MYALKYYQIVQQIIIFTMGNCQCSSENTLYDKNNWIVTAKHTYGQHIKSTKNQATVMQKWINIDQDEISKFSWRREIGVPSIPKIYDIGKNSQWQGNYIKKGVFIITVPLFELSKCRELSVTEGLFALKKIIQGLKFLVAKCGGFSIDQKMIFISSYGYPYIWIHPNVASNRSKFPLLNSKFREQQLAQQVFCIIKNKMKPNKLQPFTFKKMNIAELNKWVTDALKKSDEIVQMIENPKANDSFNTIPEERQRKLQNSHSYNNLYKFQKPEINYHKQYHQPFNTLSPTFLPSYNSQSNLFLSTRNSSQHTLQSFHSNRISLPQSIKTSTTSHEPQKNPDQLLQDLIKSQGVIIGE